MVTVTSGTFQIVIVRYTKKVKVEKYLHKTLLAYKQNIFPKAISNWRQPLLCI